MWRILSPKFVQYLTERYSKDKECFTSIAEYGKSWLILVMGFRLTQHMYLQECTCFAVFTVKVRSDSLIIVSITRYRNPLRTQTIIKTNKIKPQTKFLVSNVFKQVLLLFFFLYATELISLLMY